MKNLVFLYGAPASGKTTLGTRLAEALGVEFLDLDAEIVRTAGCPIPQIFAEKGEPYFRDFESQTLRNVIAAEGSRVVSLGGGTLLRAENRAACEAAGTIFCLDTPSEEELVRRIGSAAGSRPLGNKAKERAPHYASFPNRVARSFDLGNSLVVVGTGIAAPLLQGRTVVADANVARLHADKLPKPIAIVPSGEEHKTVETVAGLWNAFAAAGLGRKNTVVAVGGGVTGDLTGFAAATFMRGISWINVPTTLLSMVDASTGGKTGCDLPCGKNLAGAFHSPRLVVIDTDFLQTLPPEILRAGRAEMIKHEIIGGKRTGEGDEFRAKVADNLEVKVGIVREDPFETKGRRLLLNCGHTVAHAVECLSDYTLAHGDAVAIGCVEEARLAVRRGLAPETWPTELAAVLDAEGLPTEIPPTIDRARIDETMKGDKKRAGNVVTFALPCGWGDVRAVPVDLGKEKLFS